ncbi:MAG: hypothetical protein KAH48_11635 [Chlorobi bacterium]|nr:hypothetical protein [Chlorobiota bacterium]
MKVSPGIVRIADEDDSDDEDDKRKILFTIFVFSYHLYPLHHSNQRFRL